MTWNEPTAELLRVPPLMVIPSSCTGAATAAIVAPALLTFERRSSRPDVASIRWLLTTVFLPVSMTRTPPLALIVPPASFSRIISPLPSSP